MKYISDFNILLNEDYTESISKNDFIKILNDNCKNYSIKNTQLFRGVSDLSSKDNYYRFVDTSKVNRYENDNFISGGIQYSRILFDNILESWNKYPKRINSVITSTSINHANMYSKKFLGLFGKNAFNVIPFDNTILGITSNNDFYYSFNKGFGVKNEGLYNLEFFCADLQSILPKQTKNYKELLEILKTITIDENYYNFKSKLKNNNYDKTFLKLLYNFIDIRDKNKNYTLIDYFNKILDPNYNEFFLLKYTKNINIKDSEESPGHGREVYFSGKCLFVNPDILYKII